MVWKVALGCLGAHGEYGRAVLSRAAGAVVRRDGTAARPV